MPFAQGRYTLGPDSGTLSVRTRKGGAASKAGHNLLIEVSAWQAVLDVGATEQDTRLELTAESGSLTVLEGTGGISSLDDGDKAGIRKTIDAEILRGSAIAFRSTAVTGAAGSDTLAVSGELELTGRRRPIAFELRCADGHLTGAATVTQSNWGIKPYSALFGTLKVLDEVSVEVDAQLPAPTAAH